MSIFATGVIISGYIHTGKYYAAVKMNGVEQHATCVNFIDTLRRDTQDPKLCVCMILCQTVFSKDVTNCRDIQRYPLSHILFFF